MVRKQGFVAMLDILGFAERVARDSELGGLDRYIDTVLEVSRPIDGVRVILFSDTVVLYTLDDSPKAFDDIVEVCSCLAYELLLQEVPLRGAVSHGTFVRSEHELHGTVIAGRPIIEAHHYEAQLEWIGVMLAPSVLRQVPELARRTELSGPPGDSEDLDTYFARTKAVARVQACPRIPVKFSLGDEALHLEGYAVVPLSDWAVTPLDRNKCIREVLSKLRWLKQLAPDPISQSKYQNSVAWLKWLLGDAPGQDA